MNKAKIIEYSLIRVFLNYRIYSMMDYEDHNLWRSGDQESRFLRKEKVIHNSITGAWGLSSEHGCRQGPSPGLPPCALSPSMLSLRALRSVSPQ